MKKSIVEYQIKEKNTFLEAVHAGIGGTFIDKEQNTLFFPEDHPNLSGTLYHHNVYSSIKVLICSNVQIKSPFNI